ncbi:hypothetical protein SAMN02745221_00616 [Thermosyntropha lipolytica DSM 11003]|uniref:UPF0182 protein SAMN02745221_00616 n=1 Tax=Thermosyntropha lipolytica DSM 11003 TaxID=1123382 RepID=A0A1M5LAD7_9FIRM|nr:UPF0182 family protein [Thermosyntropha lipolytica]SHG61977.1 hypothetical protein SAMN02745221_00616 [Thermosyntropha lipolytica DSM 11003]
MARNNKSTIRLIVFLLLLGGISLFLHLYADFLWFKSVNYAAVFTTILLNKIVLYAAVFLAVFLLCYINLIFTRKNIGINYKDEDDDPTVIYLDEERHKSPWLEFLKGKYATWIFIGISLFIAFLISSSVADKWILVQQYINKVPFNINDPIFNKDLSFYFFNLAFYQFIYSILMSTLILITIIVGTIYLFNASSNILFGDWRQFTVAKGHMATLFAAIFALQALKYKLASYEILFSPSGIVFGATYADVYARLVSYKALVIISLVIAAVILLNIFIRRVSWIVGSIAVWLVIVLVLSGIYPGLLQKFVVQPNEFNKEKKYIENAIKYTRQAYALDQAEHKDFPVDYKLDINNPSDAPTINNIRLWDWQPLLTTYKSLQELRPYYVFNDVDIDRYVIDGKYRQVMLAAREIDPSGLPENARTWINERLMYTHGYGLVVSPVNEVEEEGFPRFFIKDIPPVFTTDLTVKRPEIYFGELTNSYVIVNTKQKEFDYPMGNTNVYCFYEGKNGIKLDSVGKKLMFAWVLKDYKMLLSSDITKESQILMNRNIVERVKKIAPYLYFDDDPYIVINKENGKLYWIIDAYTYSDKYPYSQPFDRRGNNYVRNAVKIVIDAYTGEMDFYIADKSDPVIKTYSRIFKGVFKPLEQMPPELKSHIRYPSWLFTIQAKMYQTFHMTDPNVFYNKEDIWLIPTEIVGNKPVEMEPYYIIMRLPEETEEEYILMLPFTPKNRPNMVAWMCVRNDGDNYGKMLVYNFPKQETIYGPYQLESRINQDTYISQQISLWDQRGSNVYRGNLLVIPIQNSILYVEPLYLQAENGKIPELKRVIVAFENRIVMEPTLDAALLKLFGEKKVNIEEKTPPSLEAGTDLRELAKKAREYYDQANRLLQQGDWAGYGENIRNLEKVLKQMEEAAAY